MRQELNCTNCGIFIQFDMDFGLDGNHEIVCPKCQHIHYRVVKDGKITEERWKSSMSNQTFYPTNMTTTTTSYLNTSTFTISTLFFHDSWLNNSIQGTSG